MQLLLMLRAGNTVMNASTIAPSAFSFGAVEGEG